ncbi:MAG: hypothetical protein ACHQ53_13560, partial [Polyangiales bacterium]
MRRRRTVRRLWRALGASGLATGVLLAGPPVSAAPATSPVSTRPEAVPKLAQLELDLRSRDPERQRIALAALTE